MASGDRALGLAIGTGRLVATIEAGGGVQQRDVHATVSFPGGTAEEFVDAAKGLADRLRRDLRARGGDDEYYAIGAAIPGHVNHGTGTVVYSPFASGHTPWTDEDIARRLEQEFSVPALIDNDVNCMAIDQRERGLGRNTESFVVVYVSTDLSGLGCGVVLGGSVIRGCTGGAGEAGHIVVEPGGPRCGCDNRGCLQALLSEETLIRNVNWGERRDAVRDLAEAAALADVGDARACDAFRQAGGFFGQGLSAIVNLLNPPLLVLSGPDELFGNAPTPTPSRLRRAALPERSRGRSAQIFQDSFKETLTAYTFAELESDCRIEISSITVEMAARGAALLHSDRGPSSDR